MALRIIVIETKLILYLVIEQSESISENPDHPWCLQFIAQFSHYSSLSEK